MLHSCIQWRHATYRLNGHPRTMKGKGKQDILSLMTFILSTKDCLCERKGVSNVQVAIAVWVWKSYQKGLLTSIGVRVGFKGLFGLPHFLYFNFVRTEGITFGGTLGCHRKGRHGVRRWSVAHCCFDCGGALKIFAVLGGRRATPDEACVTDGWEDGLSKSSTCSLMFSPSSG